MASSPHLRKIHVELLTQLKQLRVFVSIGERETVKIGCKIAANKKDLLIVLIDTKSNQPEPIVIPSIPGIEIDFKAATIAHYKGYISCLFPANTFSEIPTYLWHSPESSESDIPLDLVGSIECKVCHHLIFKQPHTIDMYEILPLLPLIGH